MSDLTIAFLLPLLAGLSTGIGGLIAMFAKKNDTNFLAVCISFSAGVMIYVSFVEIFRHALEDLEYLYGDTGFMLTTVAFFAGIAFCAILDKAVPHEDAAVTAYITHSKKTLTKQDARMLKRMGIMTAIAIAIHNFPEGLVTFMAAMHDPSLGIAIAAAIAIHNIPEGIAVAAPIHYATGSKKKALLVSIAAGLTEPLGALFGFLLLTHIFDEAVLGFVFAAVGGIMIYISFNQLLPAALRFCEHKKVILGLFAGMAVMAASLLVL